MDFIFDIFEGIGGCLVGVAIILVVAALVLCCVGFFFLGMFN